MFSKKIRILIAIFLSFFPLLAQATLGNKTAEQAYYGLYKFFIVISILSTAIILLIIMRKNRGQFKRPFLLFLMLEASYLLVTGLIVIYFLGKELEYSLSNNAFYLFTWFSLALLLLMEILLSYIWLKMFVRMPLSSSKIFFYSFFLSVSPIPLLILF